MKNKHFFILILLTATHSIAHASNGSGNAGLKEKLGASRYLNYLNGKYNFLIENVALMELRGAKENDLAQRQLKKVQKIAASLQFILFAELTIKDTDDEMAGIMIEIERNCEGITFFDGKDFHWADYYGRRAQVVKTIADEIKAKVDKQQNVNAKAVEEAPNLELLANTAIPRLPTPAQNGSNQDHLPQKSANAGLNKPNKRKKDSCVIL